MQEWCCGMKSERNSEKLSRGLIFNSPLGAKRELGFCNCLEGLIAVESGSNKNLGL